MTNFLVAVALLGLLCCNNPETAPSADQKPDSIAEPKVYFPVIDYLQSEIKYVDSLPVGIMKYTTQDGRTDSGYIKPEEFHRLAQEFISPVLTKDNFEKEYKESSFFDNTTKYSSFLYSTNNGSLPIQRIDVIAKPEDIVYNKVKSIYMEKFFDKGDSSFTEKLYWKAGENFLISTEIRTPSQEVITRQVKVVWNPWH